MYLKYLILFLLVLWKASGFTQSLSELKNQEINRESLSEENLDSFITNIYSFIGEDFDSLDIQIFLTGPVLGAFMVEMAHKGEVFNYGDVYEKFIELKNLPEYFLIKEELIIAKELMRRPADYQNWEEDKSQFIKLGYEGDLLESLRGYIKENSNAALSYEKVLVGFLKEQQEIDERENEARDKVIKKYFYTSKLFNEAEILAQSKLENKPILLYFTGYANVNCRKFENMVLIDPEVAEVLMKEYILAPLFVDDRTELPVADQMEVKVGDNKKDLMTIGARHQYYQISRFKVSSEPYFVVLNEENEILGISHNSAASVVEFLLFLKTSLSKFDK